MCIYQDVRKEWPFTRNLDKSGHSYTFVEKKGANHILGSAEKGGHSARTSVPCHIQEVPALPPPPPPPHTHTHTQPTPRVERSSETEDSQIHCNIESTLIRRLRRRINANPPLLKMPSTCWVYYNVIAYFEVLSSCPVGTQSQTTQKLTMSISTLLQCYTLLELPMLRAGMFQIVLNEEIDSNLARRMRSTNAGPS